MTGVLGAKVDGVGYSGEVLEEILNDPPRPLRVTSIGTIVPGRPEGRLLSEIPHRLIRHSYYKDVLIPFSVPISEVERASKRIWDLCDLLERRYNLVPRETEDAVEYVYAK